MVGNEPAENSLKRPQLLGQKSRNMRVYARYLLVKPSSLLSAEEWVAKQLDALSLQKILMIKRRPLFQQLYL